MFAVVVESKGEEEEDPALDETYDDEAEIVVAKGFCVFQDQVDLGQLRGQALGHRYRQGNRTLERHVYAAYQLESGDDDIGFNP